MALHSTQLVRSQSSTVGDSYSPVDPAVPISDLKDFDLHDENRVVHEVEGRFKAAYDESRYLRSYDWRRNWEFANGNQWIYWNAEIPDFVPLPVPEEMRYTENQLRGTLRQAVNLLVQGDPAYDCAPLNTDWDSRESARMAKPLLLHYTREFKLGRLRVQNVIDSILFGFGIRKTYYQPAGGGVRVTYKQAETPTGAEAEPRLHSRTREPLIDTMDYVGEMRQEARSPWGWFPQPGSEGPYLNNMDFCIDTDWVSPAWIKRAYPDVDIDELDHERQQTMPYQLTQPGDLNWNIFGQSPNRRAAQGKVLVITYYQIPAPVRGHEKGLEIRICGNHVLDIRPLQTCPNEPTKEDGFDAPLPFSIYASEPRRGTFYPRPPASDWVEPQMRINQTLSHQYTYAGICAGPNLLSTKGDHLPKTVSFGFEKWEIPPGIEDPRWLPAPPVPPWLFEMKAEASQALDRVSMNFGATRGERSKQDPSGYYLDVLREHDQIDLQSTVRDHAQSHEEDGNMLLVLAKKYEPQERMLQVVGANGRPQLHRFVRDKLRPEKVRVYVQATSIMPYLATSRQRSMMELTENGWFGPHGQMPPPIRRKLINWINLPGLYEIDDIDSDDVRLAERNHSRVIDEGAISLPSQPPQGMDPKQFAQQVQQLQQEGKALIIDPDWDPNELLPLAIARKKEDDAAEWPQETRANFEGYIAGLKQLQQQQAEVAKQAAIGQAREQMALELEMDKAKQDNQAEGRSKVKMAEAAAKAMMSDDPAEMEQIKADVATKAAVAKAGADHIFKSAQIDQQADHDKEMAEHAAAEAAQKAKGKKER